MLSIVMPTYNQAHYLRESLDSILEQSYGDFELIVVNDGSTDDTAKVLEAYALKDDRIIILEKENGGTGSALNMGFFEASGEYETWFASDNVMFPHCLQTLMDYLAAHPDIDYVYSHCDIHQMDDSLMQCIGVKPLMAEVKHQEFTIQHIQQAYFLGICWVWRRALRQRAGQWFQHDPCEDYDMVLRMAYCGGQFGYVPDTLGWFRRHKNNISTQIKKTSYPQQAKQHALDYAKEKGWL